MKKLTLRTFAVGLVLVLVLSFAVFSASADEGSPFAGVDVNTGSIVLQPQVEFEYVGLILTVSGPNDIAVRYEYEPGATPMFSAFREDGKPYPDGVYTYELQVIPYVGPEASAAFEAALESRDPEVVEQLKAQGLLPAVIPTQTGTFSLKDSTIVSSTDLKELGADESGRTSDSKMAPEDQVILDDLIVDGSACIGQDCNNGESFGFDTIRLKENNLRIKAEDTSNSASFPSRDWQTHL